MFEHEFDAQNAASRFESELANNAEQVAKIEAEVLFWGEPDASDIAGFLSTWLRFVQAFQKIVKFNAEQEKREETRRQKAEQRDKKSETRRTINKFVGDVRKSVRVCSCSLIIDVFVV